MKKLTANSGQMRGGEERDVIETLKMFLPASEVSFKADRDDRPIAPAWMRT
ncbi:MULTISPECIES: hypothetical protein [Bradyrhizobium]|uniref:hypothetical protein n=1 Tax=Bradyrhizobium TaxID=374 RepID=UPI00040E3864|nr:MULTISPECIES: hypothetical protein [Bradyrhizobium]UFW54110.1 hypothetical protein BaraCB756_06005 [Bradyrhizobium arachidis]